jgi:hypothetical protein
LLASWVSPFHNNTPVIATSFGSDEKALATGRLDHGHDPDGGVVDWMEHVTNVQNG